MRNFCLIASVVLVATVWGCTGEQGEQGAAGEKGEKGDPGEPGKAGEQGPKGEDASGSVEIGGIEGRIVDESGTHTDGVKVTAVRGLIFTSSSGEYESYTTIGNFRMENIPVGTYTLKAEKTGYETTNLTGVGVVEGKTTSVEIVMFRSKGALGKISGIVKGAGNIPLQGAVVSVENQDVSTTTGSDGSFSLDGVSPGFVYIYVKAPEGFLDGGNRKSHYLAPGSELKDLEIVLSGRPSKAAEYLGEAGCIGCHSGIANEQHKAGHHRFVNEGTSRMVLKEMWPAVGSTLDSKVDALDPVNGTEFVRVYLCQNQAGVYSMKFGGQADCLAGDTTLIEVKGTIGGEGDGGINNVPNFGVYKQRFLARPTDVPYAKNKWTVAYPDADKDFLILPVYVVQWGNDDPVFGAISPKFDPIYPDKWVKQARTIGRLCAGCHATGAKSTFEDTEFLLTSYSYVDLNITCERCHGPGSEHFDGNVRLDKIINPKRLTAKAAQEACGQCHAAHSGTSGDPAGKMKNPFNASKMDDVGNGYFVPGLYDLSTFINGYGVSLLDGGGVDTWPDRIHSIAHSEQMPMLSHSAHGENPYHRLACFDCHDSHSTYYGPQKFKMTGLDGDFELKQPRLNDNTLCLACHAETSEFEGVTREDVAVLHSLNDVAKQEGTTVTFDDKRIYTAKANIAKSIADHMELRASMGMAVYDPLNDKNPVGRCSSCHMPKTAKKNATKDITQWRLGWDGNGQSAMVEGNAASHVFDIVWPWQSSILKKNEGGKDLDIMPNSCGKCHPGSRLSGD